MDDEPPEVVVIDSINTQSPAKQQVLFQALNTLCDAPKLQLLVLILDAHDDKPSDFWSYVCDMVVRMDRINTRGYLVRTIEIVKARYQEHVWGTHQLKLYGKQAPSTDPDVLRLQHPYCAEGGIFIFPSIHFHLSRAKRRIPSGRHVVETPLESLNKLFERRGAAVDGASGGIPRGRCVGIMGKRGGHKSHLAYAFILQRLQKGEHCIVVSLRDDAQLAMSTMKSMMVGYKIVQQGASEEEMDRVLKSWRDDGRLEILYFPPGYITPEEFFHRVYITVRRAHAHRAPLDADGVARINLMFNSLDQLASRFPLCADQQIFIPGLVEMLAAERVTSMFIGVTSDDQPIDQYGLLPMVDTLLTVNRGADIVRMSLERAPAGQRGGATGVLDLKPDATLTWDIPLPAV